MANITRRQFLKQLSLGASIVLLARCGPATEAPATTSEHEQSPDTHPQQPQVIIVGAGISGLAAARTLQAEGIKVILLEGRDRIGGRIFTNTTLGVPIDLGASWIHGYEGNPITDLAQTFGVETAVTDYADVVLYDFNGDTFDTSELVYFEQELESFMADVGAYAEEVDDDISVEAAIQALLEDEEDLSPEDRRVLNWYLSSLLETNYGTDLRNLSLFHADQGGGFRGKDHLFPGGYTQIIQGLTKDLDVRLEHQVQKIAYGQEKVSVATNQGDFEADYVIVTVPLGVLKAETIHFDPPLPKEKQQAIQRLGMGVLNKLVLKFPVDSEEWPFDTEFVGYASKAQRDFSIFLNLHTYTGQPILMGFVAGEFAQALEQSTDAEIIEQLLTVLQTLSDEEVPQPSGSLITRWASDPFSLGSYSHVPVGASGDDYDTLAEPVKNKLFFAGEATHRNYPSTVHGAFMSGLREAARIMDNKAQ